MTTNAEVQLVSPATMNLAQLLHTVAAGDEWPIDDALFLTFGFDPGFFERGILGRCRAAGAVVTAIADATLWAPDPIALRTAGQEYLLGLAATPRAFHPKLMLLHGGDGALAAIGSGNLTTSGWQYNTELWRCFEATPAGAPTQPLRGLVDWLDQLATTATLAAPHRDALRRHRDKLRNLLDRLPEQPSPARVLPLNTPIIDALPQGPVDELLLAAPFIDPATEAVAALLARLQPARTTVVLQEHLGRFDPTTLTRVLAGAAGEVTVVADRSRRYRHAKLIEWSIVDRRWAVSGSANLTGSALLRTPATGGNIELAVLEELTAPVWPPPTLSTDAHDVVALADLPRPAAPFTATETALAGLPLLLSVTRDGRDLVVELAGRCPPQVELQARNHPLDGAWQTVGPLPAGAPQHKLPGSGVEDTALLRLAGLGGADPVWGQPVPVTDLARATRPPLLGGGRHRRIASSDDLLGDDLGYLAAFGDQLAALANERRTTPTATSPTAAATTTVQAGRHDDTTNPQALWRWEQSARGLHGPALTGFALGLPPAAPGEAWEDFDTTIGELAGDSAITSRLSEPDTGDDDLDDEPVDHRHQQVIVRRARQRWVQGYADSAHRENRDRIRHHTQPPRSALSALSWLAVTRLSLVFYTAGNWTDDDETPVQHLAQFLTNLQEAVAAGDERLAETVALAAVTVAAVRQHAGTGATDPAAVAARRVEDTCRTLLTTHQPQPQLLAEYCRCLATPGGLLLLPDDVTAELDAWLHQPLRHAVQLAETRGWDPTEASPYVLEVAGRLGNPADAAATLLAGTGDGPVAIDATATNGQRGIAIWAPPDLYLIRIHGSRQTWEHYTHPTIDPILTSWAADDRGRYRRPHIPARNPIPDAADWITALDISI